MKKHTLIRLMALCLTLVMILSTLPATALAAVNVDAVNSATGVKNVILMIGDGMGLNHVEAADMPNLKSIGKTTTCTTYSASDSVTDSAAAATALATGVKTTNGYVGINPSGSAEENLVEMAQGLGMKTGVVVTQVLCHATPAGFTAHDTSRYNYDQIARDQIASGVDVMMGGGSNYYNQYSAALQRAGYTYVNSNNLSAIPSSLAGGKVLAAFGSEAIQTVNGSNIDQGYPKLSAMTSKALDLLDDDGNGFFLMVEGSDIDTYSHQNNVASMLSEAHEFDNAIGVAKAYVDAHSDTLLIVTADHETGGLTYNSGSGQWEFTSDYDGGGSRKHTGANVGVYAYGAGASGLTSHGVIDNTDIHDYIQNSLSLYTARTPVTEPAGNTVYFRNTNNWSSVYLYAWDGNGYYPCGSWPGSQMVLVSGETNLYSYTGDLLTSDNGIFTTSIGSPQTTDIVGVQFNHVYYLTGATSDGKYVTAIDSTEQPTVYNVTVQNDGNGSASASPASAAAGTTVTLTATANSGYHFKAWQVISGGVTISENQFTMPAGHVTVKAVFEKDAADPDPQPTSNTVYFLNKNSWEHVYLYVFYPDSNGDGVEEKPLGAYPGTEMTKVEGYENLYAYTDTAGILSQDYSYKFASGRETSANYQRTENLKPVQFGAVYTLGTETGTAKYNVVRTSMPDPTAYTVTVATDGNGTASASPASAAAGTTITLSTTANSGYHFKEWQVISGGVTISENQFTMPAGNVSVKAVFEKDAADPGETGCVFYFQKPASWGSVYIYLWDNSSGTTIHYTGSWPGTQMTAVPNGDGLYTYTYTGTDLGDGAQVIFNAGNGGEQTVDIDNANVSGKVYNPTNMSDGKWLVNVNDLVSGAVYLTVLLDSSGGLPGEPARSTFDYAAASGDYTVGYLRDNQPKYSTNAANVIDDAIYPALLPSVNGDGTKGIVDVTGATILPYIPGVNWDAFLQGIVTYNQTAGNQVTASDGEKITASNCTDYKIVPYVIKHEIGYSEGWHIDCRVMPKDYVSLKYDPNLPEGETVGSDLSVPHSEDVARNSTRTVGAVMAGETTVAVKGSITTTKGTKLYFQGWKDSQDQVYLPGGSITVAENTTLYAIWTKVENPTCTVKYVFRSGTEDVSLPATGMPDVPEKDEDVSGSYPVDATKYSPVNETVGDKTYVWTFEGWYTDEAMNAPAKETISVHENTTLYGKWTRTETFTVTYADGVDGVEIFEDQVKKVPSGDLTPAFVGTPLRDDYRFTGWKSSADDQTYSSEELASKQVTSNVTYTAQWELIPNPNLSVEKELTEIKRGNEVVYSAASGQTIPKAQVGDTLTYTITVTNTGNVALSNITVTDTLKADNDSRTPALSNSTIDSLAVGGTANITVTYTIDKDDAGKTLANSAAASIGSDKLGEDSAAGVEVKNQYTVTYAWDSSKPADFTGTLPASATVNEGDSYTVSTQTYADVTTGNGIYTFLGWYDNTGVKQITLEHVYSDVTLYGKWGFEEFAKATVKVEYALYNADGTVLLRTLTDTGASVTGTVGTSYDLSAYQPATIALDGETYEFKSQSSNAYKGAIPEGGLTITRRYWKVERSELTVDKTVSAASAKVGDRITYTIKITNSGNVDLTNIKVTDAMLGESATITKLSAGETVILQYAYTVPEASAGKTITNVVEVKAGNGTTGTDSCTTQIAESSSDVLFLNQDDHVAYIIGYEDGTVKPLGTITRAEVATIFFRLMTDEARNYYWCQTNPFTDVPASAWYNNAVSTLNAAGVIVDSRNGKFRPNEPITRAEFAVMAAQFTNMKASTKTSSFTDVPSYHWAAAEIALVEQQGWIKGDGNGKFRPDATITRAEAMAIVNRMLERGVEKGHMISTMVQWIDNPTTAWYYADVQEATNSHTYVRLTKQVPDEDYCYEEWQRLLANPNWAALEKVWSRANSR